MSTKFPYSPSPSVNLVSPYYKGDGNKGTLVQLFTEKEPMVNAGDVITVGAYSFKVITTIVIEDIFDNMYSIVVQLVTPNPNEKIDPAQMSKYITRLYSAYRDYGVYVKNPLRSVNITMKSKNK